MFISQTLSRGGAERVISVLSTALVELGHEVIVAKYFSTNGEYPIGEKVIILNLSGGDIQTYKKIGKLKTIKALRRAIKNYMPSCIIPFTYPVAQLTEIASAGLHIPVFQSIRINPSLGPAQQWKRWLRDRLVYKSKCTFVQNKQQAEYFKDSYQDKIHVLSNPVSDALFSIDPKPLTTEFVISALGRLTEQKNYRLLIDAFTEAFANEQSVKLQIYGDGEKKNELQSLIDQKRMQSQIVLMGRTDDVMSVYKNTDIYVLSSDWEGMPNTLIEAMAAHVLSISTDCPTGPAELIQNEENGYLVPMRDKEALKSKLLQVYSLSYEERLAISKKARETVKLKCSSHNIANEMNKICETIIKEQSSNEQN